MKAYYNQSKISSGFFKFFNNFNLLRVQNSIATNCKPNIYVLSLLYYLFLEHIE